MKKRPVMIYNGGKFLLADWIVESLPTHRIYVEPFGGAASVLMRKPRSHREVYNDLNSEIVNVFKVLRDKQTCAHLKDQLRLTPFAREEMQIAKRIDSVEDVVERARRTIVCAFMSRSRQSRDGAGMRYSKQSNRAPEQDWVTYLDSLDEFCARLRGVMIENKPALELLPFWDAPDTLFYLDPPYLHETRGSKKLYAFEMSDTQHVELLESLNTLRGMVVLSGYNSAMYAKHLPGWSTRQFNTKTARHRAVQEVLWLNPAAQKNTRQTTFEFEYEEEVAL